MKKLAENTVLCLQPVPQTIVSCRDKDGNNNALAVGITANMLMGSKSGRDTDKDAASGLTVRDLGNAVTYEEAEVTLLCKKIYFQDMDRANMPADVVRQHYATEEPHRTFIGEVVEVIGK